MLFSIPVSESGPLSNSNWIPFYCILCDAILICFKNHPCFHFINFTIMEAVCMHTICFIKKKNVKFLTDIDLLENLSSEFIESSSLHISIRLNTISWAAYWSPEMLVFLNHKSYVKMWIWKKITIFSSYSLLKVL